ncbi:MAG: MoxR family ATPase [Polyangiaceae bacterium]
MNDLPARLAPIRSALSRVLEGKGEVIDLLLVGVLAEGHVLIEDVPGVGKTTLAKALARTFATTFTRIQFTPDLLPSDILGAQILNPREGSFTFQKGPIFTQVLLADEINRASPRTQSALLEAMNEGQVTIDGKTHALPAPFFVLATQNPSDSTGTYPLPEAQLDRFLLRLSVGYPSEDAELRMLDARRRSNPLDTVEPVADAASLAAMQAAVREVAVDERVARYLLRIVQRTRDHGDLALGVSPRGALALYRATQARAFVAGRSFVSPDDVQALVGPVLGHRVALTPQARYAGSGTEAILAKVVESVVVPA